MNGREVITVRWTWRCKEIPYLEIEKEDNRSWDTGPFATAWTTRICFAIQIRAILAGGQVRRLKADAASDHLQGRNPGSLKS